MQITHHLIDCVRLFYFATYAYTNSASLYFWAFISDWDFFAKSIGKNREYHAIIPASFAEDECDTDRAESFVRRAIDRSPTSSALSDDSPETDQTGSARSASDPAAPLQPSRPHPSAYPRRRLHYQLRRQRVHCHRGLIRSYLHLIERGCLLVYFLLLSWQYFKDLLALNELTEILVMT